MNPSGVNSVDANSPSLVLVLAAGEGTRMRSATPKVLHPVLGRPMLGHVLSAVSGVNPQHTAVVVGAGREHVEQWLGASHPEVLTTVQHERRGTGHAVMVALEDLSAAVSSEGTVMVLTGDTPLLRASTLEALLMEHAQSAALATVLTATLEDPTGYGRIVRNHEGAVVAIVEHKDATEEQRSIAEINSGIYVFDAQALRTALPQLSTNNSQGELYLTDVLALIHQSGGRVSAHVADDFRDVWGVNDRLQLADAARVMQQRINERWMREGVSIVDPATTWIDADAVIARDVTIYPSTYIQGDCAIDEQAVIGPDTTLVRCRVEAGAHVVRSQATDAHIGPHVSVGPFSFLRPGTILREHSKAGAFVEMKNADLGANSKVPHLSYVGDATIGSDSNIGAATIFVNYDGVNKHHTTVGDAVRIGSDSMLVAPITIGDGAYTAAGSVITEDVPPGAIGVGRARQRNILGWVRMKRAGSSSDVAATKALSQSTDETESQ